MLNIIKAYAVKNLCYIAAQKMVPQGIVVHSTGANNPNLKRYVDAADEVGINKYGNHWNTAKPGGRKVCVHAFIGYDKNREVRVAEILPLNICCWGVGKGKKGSYNTNPAYIQFEICEDGLKDKTYYRKVFDVAVKYCVELCQKYSIPINNIVGHCESYRMGYGSNHSDPEHWMKKHGETMDDFRRAVTFLFNKDNNVVNESQAGVMADRFFKNGDLVSIKEGATYYNGKTIPDWVQAQKWYVKGDSSTDRIVIDKNEKGTNSICSPIHKKYLSLEKVYNERNTIDITSKGAYRVKVITDSLNIRRGSGTNYSINGTITDQGVYTIVEENDGQGATKWGKLKSGAGWISLDYVIKL